MKGPGKYNEFATLVRERTSADAVILIVMRGAHGTGMSVQCVDEPHARLDATDIAAILRAAAADIERGDG